MSEEPRTGPGLVDLEKELLCSVSDRSLVLWRLFLCRNLTPWTTAHFLEINNEYKVPYLLTSLLDLYRAPLPTPYPPRLSPHFLRLLSERVVLCPGLTAKIIQLAASIYMSVMSGGCARDPTKCHGQHVVGYVLRRQP